MKQKFTTFAFLLTLLGTVSACSTIRGAGDDIEKGGEAIQEISEDARDEM